MLHYGDRTKRTTGRTRGRVRPRCARKGFTLLETALATVIIGVGVLAMVEAQASFSRLNNFSTAAATANYLANEIREKMRNLPRHDPVTSIFMASVNGTATLRGWGPESGELSINDYNDLDDFDGAVFGTGGTFAGPVDSRGLVISEINPDGSVMMDQSNRAVSLRGWSQRVLVEKVDPQNLSLVRDRAYTRAAAGQFAGLNVDQFPLRVTITVSYQGPLDTRAAEMGKLVFIAPYSPVR